MDNKDVISVISETDIKEKIYTVRGVQVMLDSDLAKLYGVETKALNQAVKRNQERFPLQFMFQLCQNELENLRSQNVTSKISSKTRALPHAFTEQGVAMLSTVLRSETAVKVSIQIMEAFVSMRHYLVDNKIVFQRLNNLELSLLKTNEKVDSLFKQLEDGREKKAALFFKGQLFDAFSCLADIISKAKETIVVIDNYVDTGTLDLLSKKKVGVLVDLITSQKGCKLTTKEISDFNSQYGNLELKFSEEFHDRFMILDNKVLYHVGASLKDAGRKAFEISVIDDEGQLQELCGRIK